MSRLRDLTGQQFRFLKALRFVGIAKDGHAVWEFFCTRCGGTLTATGSCVTKKGSQMHACGCLPSNWRKLCDRPK
jgi:hypothetical protein